MPLLLLIITFFTANLAAQSLPLDIAARMQFYNVPAVSIAVIEEGQLAWAEGFGHATHSINSPRVNANTLFQAGSISKSLTAFGALLLVQRGKLSLDEDVNHYLTRWKVPENGLTRNQKVTLRRLLSHTAGTNIHGFGGYPQQGRIPTLVEVLNGEKPYVKTPPVQVMQSPGKEMKYSGGGYTIVQLLIEEVTGERFDVWMQKNVLEPLGMVHSTFTQPLPPNDASHAVHGFLKGGRPIPGGWMVFPFTAAGGLWTTPSDLAQFITYIQSALTTGSSPLLNIELVREMVTRQKQGSNYGLGVGLNGQGENLVFRHTGKVAGFIARYYAQAYLGRGIIIMADSDDARPLVEEIVASYGVFKD